MIRTVHLHINVNSSKSNKPPEIISRAPARHVAIR